MAVWGPHERFELELREQVGWFGAQATGAFGTVEGWVQLRPHTAGPKGYGNAIAEGEGLLCGMAGNGDRFIR